MQIFFMDSSALVKRYVAEVGSEWILHVCEAQNPKSLVRSNLVMVAEITLVEVAAAIAKRVKRTKELGEAEGNDAYKLFVEHYENEYKVNSLTPALVRVAVDLARKHALRAYDAVQLATALDAKNLLKANDLSLTFVASDNTLLQAARAEDMAAENPFDHRDLDLAQ